MTAADPALVAALEPVRGALFEAARVEADDTRARAEAQARTILAAARQQADAILAAARAEGGADAAAALTAQRAQARRQARSVVLRARREAYEALRVDARAAMTRLCDEPGYGDIRARLVAAIHERLGPRAAVRDAPGGGVVGEVPGRRLDLSLAAFADRAVDRIIGAEEPP